MKFVLMRLSMQVRRQIDGFERERPSIAPWDRESWLRAVFGEQFTFFHRGRLFHYTPDPELILPEIGEQPSQYIAGRVGRQVTTIENLSPEEGLVEAEHQAWQAARVLIDPRHHEDGQKVAQAEDSDVGKPLPVFESLIDSVNNRGTEPYFAELRPIVQEQSFWEFVERNKGEITSVTFEFVAPNMFDESANYDKEMADLKAKEEIEKAKLILESKKGLNLNTKRVQGAVDYVKRGTGSIKAQTKTKKTYSSRDKAKKITIKEVPPTLSGLLILAKRYIFGE